MDLIRKRKIYYVIILRNLSTIQVPRKTFRELGTHFPLKLEIIVEENNFLGKSLRV